MLTTAQIVIHTNLMTIVLIFLLQSIIKIKSAIIFMYFSKGNLLNFISTKRILTENCQERVENIIWSL